MPKNRWLTTPPQHMRSLELASVGTLVVHQSRVPSTQLQRRAGRLAISLLLIRPQQVVPTLRSDYWLRAQPSDTSDNPGPQSAFEFDRTFQTHPQKITHFSSKRCTRWSSNLVKRTLMECAGESGRGRGRPRQGWLTRWRRWPNPARYWTLNSKAEDRSRWRALITALTLRPWRGSGSNEKKKEKKFHQIQVQLNTYLLNLFHKCWTALFYILKHSEADFSPG